MATSFLTYKAQITDIYAAVRRDLVTATAAIASMASFVFGALTNLPVALA